MKEVSEITQLQETVISGNYCIGCGACAAIKGSPFKIKMDEFGNYVAYLDNTQDNNEQIKLLDICPFSGNSKNEDELGEILFPNNKKDNHIGNYLKSFAGYVVAGDFRLYGSSGGFGKWLGYTLLKENKIDYFIQVVANTTMSSDIPLFDYQVFSSADDIIKGAKSCYYPVTLTKVINLIEETEGRYAITGVPCFIKSLRLLSFRNSILADRISFTFGIVCGGMRSANQAKMIGWQLGVHPDNLIGIDFRRKHISKPAKNKIYQVWSNQDNIERMKLENEILGINYPGYFKPNACDYCDDVVNETADISLGDAWLPQYVSDPKGTSLIIVRNKVLLDLIERYINLKVLYLEEISKEDVIKSQEGGFRHRREALSYRLAKKEENNEWFPKKRILPNQFLITPKRKIIYSLREVIAKESPVAFLNALKMNNFKLFTKRMKPIEHEYILANHNSFYNRALQRIKWFIKGVLGKQT